MFSGGIVNGLMDYNGLNISQRLQRWIELPEKQHIQYSCLRRLKSNISKYFSVHKFIFLDNKDI